MSAAVFMMVMSASFFNPSFAFSSHFDTDGAPLSELSWSSSLAVVVVSFSGLFTFIFLMLACLCCKKGDIGFKEFDNTEGEEYQTDLSAVGSPASQTDPEVYVLPLTEVSVPVSKQPSRSVQLLKSSDLGRHSLLYLKEIGHGWFGKVLLGEVNAGHSATQVVVRELKASASIQEQMRFLEEVQPYRALQHPALLQCLAQCSEVTPYLLVMEFCPLGDMKGYLRSCRATDSMTPDPLILQRIACEIASGLLHLHKYSYIHSDLALRNCLLTADMTVKIGDYGLSHEKYKDDYFVTPDQLWVPLRWIAPEIVDEVHGNLLTVDQTKSSNVWSLGVTIWELFELGNQPYRHYSDRQVLTYAVKEQQLRLPKPLLKIPLSERWYEVMQFCWLQPDQRPTAEEVHLLLGYLCAKGSSEGEEEFEARWSSMRPGAGHGGTEVAVELASSASSSFPLLENFSVGESFPDESGDDILTVTETSHGLNFEYKWEQMRHEQPYCASSTSGRLGQSNPLYQDIYYPTRGATDSSGGDRNVLGVSPSFYKAKELNTPGVVPVLSAHSPSVSSEYYIRIEEPVECNINLDCSPSFEGHFSGMPGSGDSGNCPGEVQANSYWSAGTHKTDSYDSDTSLTVSPTMEPLLRRASGDNWNSGQRFSYKDGEEEYHQHSPGGTDNQLLEDCPTDTHQNRWGMHSLSQGVNEIGSPFTISPPLCSPKLGYCDPYLEGRQGSIESKSTAIDVYNTMMGSLQKATSGPCTIDIDIETEENLIVEELESSSGDEAYLFTEKVTSKWSSNCSSNNNHLNFECGPCVRGVQETCVDIHYTTTFPDMGSSWPEIAEVKDIQHSAINLPIPLPHSEIAAEICGGIALNEVNIQVLEECGPYSPLCNEGNTRSESLVNLRQMAESPPFIDALISPTDRNFNFNSHLNQEDIEMPWEENKEIPSPSTGGSVLSLTEPLDSQGDSELGNEESRSNVLESNTADETIEQAVNAMSVNVVQASPSALSEKAPCSPTDVPQEPASESSQTADSGLEASCFSVSMVDIDNCSDDDDDITDVTSGIFTDIVDSVEVTADINVTIKHHQKTIETPDSVDSVDLPSVTGSCETFSPTSFCPSSQSKALDSGYDTENNESPEFILKDTSEPRLIGSPVLGVVEAEMVLQVDLDKGVDAVVSLSASNNTKVELTSLSEKNPYRDSAYFSDYDTENERWSREDEGDFPEKLGDNDLAGQEAEKEDLSRYTGTEQFSPHIKEGGKHYFEGLDKGRDIIEFDNKPESSASSVPVLSTLSPSPPEMGGCLTKESSQDEGLGLDSEHSGEDQSSECTSSSSTVSTVSSAQQEYSASGDQVKKGTEDSPGPLSSNSTSEDIPEEVLRELEGDKDELVPDCTGAEEKVEVDENGSWGTSSKTLKNHTDEMGLSETVEDTVPLVPIADGEDADEEETDDSEESDEELGCYNIQEQSEESDEELPAVPIVVSDRSNTRHLRSLLKMPSLLTESFCDELDRKKKAVSFFDDVTVYLFDQESPTGDLVEPIFPSGEESSGQPNSDVCDPSAKASVSDDSSDGNVSEESGGFEWDDDFPLMSDQDAVMPAAEEPATCTPSPVVPEAKPVAPFSRFSVSRFSITHVSDSDVESAGGSSEDGDRE
ncbi:serine/threonine-protein kinase LMTK1-like isoform X3 [Paramormyrops kingsleyae]|uniref:non-specific serine/threonine protein kinase n=1 Tax=Paramormyrops kingsleyae TaxID=1676925 RepID=A0A3B3TAW5_9TELE|nr:serine/threonine-protein kinase LMTK1-like isoform X3 [Paramormyrops kingsleyae]